MKPFLKQISISFVMTYLFLNYCKCKNENNLRTIPIGTRKNFLKINQFSAFVINNLFK